MAPSPGFPRQPIAEEPDESYIASEFDRQLWSDIPVAAFSLAVLFALFAVAHPFTVGGSNGWKLAGLAALSAVTLFAFGLWSRRSPSYHLSNLVAAIFAAIVLLNSAFHLAVTADPKQFTNLMVLVIAIGTFFLSLRWCAGAIAVVGAVWMAMLVYVGRAHAMHYMFAFVTTSLVAALAFRFRTRALRRSIVGAWTESRHLEQLERVDAELLKVNSELEDRVNLRTAELQRQVEQTLRMEQAVLESEKLATTGRMAAALAHEINNPLDAIVNCLYLLDHGNLSSAEQKYLDLAKQELQRVVRITRHTLSFYRKDDKPAIFDCSELAAEVIRAFQPMAAGLGIRLEARIRSKQTLEGFPGEIRQVLTNLIINALDSGGAITRVRVINSRDRRNPAVEGVRISVADNGKGISKADAPNLFEPFFTTKGEKGTGLGLWVCRGIVQNHHGTIRVRSMVRPQGAASVFSVFIPFALASQVF
jgi:signal transduction histidine kinase